MAITRLALKQAREEFEQRFLAINTAHTVQNTAIETLNVLRYDLYHSSVNT
jgi:hypothetical protein